MRTIDEINDKIRSGDQKLAADLAECTSDYVGMVLRKERKSERVVKILNQIIDNREGLFKTYKK